MQKFINNPENLTSELLEGLVLSNPDIITLEQGNLIVNKKLAEADRVTIVTLGGTGHEPAISGFVGEGMIDISVAGNIFAAPGPQACVEAIKMADKGHGVLFVVLNHAGDMLTGNLTMKQVKKLGINVVKVVTQEDVANATRENADAAVWLAAFLCIKLPVLQLLQANPWKRLLLLHKNLLITWQLSLLLLKVLLIPQPVWKSLILPKALWKSAWASMVKAVAVLSRNLLTKQLQL